MRAIHVNSFAPLLARGGLSRLEAFDLYNTVISALTWRRHNGEIDLICDKAAHEYYESLGITGIWSSVKPIIPDDLEGINPVMFWAAAKLLALREVPSPVAMLDTDFIVWIKLQFDEKIIAAHEEELFHDIYPDTSYFNMQTGYIFNESYDYSVFPLNTAFLYLPDEDFKQYYVNMSLDFMKSAQSCDDTLCYMVYAEQRLLALCAEYLKQPVKTLLHKDRLFDKQDSYTHLWGAKQHMRDSKDAEAAFRQRCINRIRTDFPEYEYVINSIEGENP